MATNPRQALLNIHNQVVKLQQPPQTTFATSTGQPPKEEKYQPPVSNGNTFVLGKYNG